MSCDNVEGPILVVVVDRMTKYSHIIPTVLLHIVQAIGIMVIRINPDMRN